MTAQQATTEELKAFDKLVDSEYFDQPLPFGCWSEAALAILAAYELEVGTGSPKEPLIAWGSDVNSLKFALQHALELVRRRYGGGPVRLESQLVTGPAIRSAKSILYRGSHYHDAVCALTSAFAGFTSAHIECGARLVLLGSPPQVEHEVLDGLTDGMESGRFVTAAISESATDLIRRASGTTIKTAQLVGRDLLLPDDPGFLAGVASVTASEPRVIPDQWVWAGLGGADVGRVLNALRDFAIFREFQAIVASRRFGLKRPPTSALVRREDASFVHSCLGRLSGVNQDVVLRVLSLLHYGHRTTSPDPALQPVFPISGGGEYYLPLGLIGTSRVQRNFLTLAARIDREGYASASHVFSTAMTRRAQEWLSRRSDWDVRPKVNIPSRPDLGDIDLLVASPRERRLLLIELKASLEAADMREFIDKNKAAEDACIRHSQRVAAVRAEPSRLLRACHLPEGDLAWDISGLVVFSSFSREPHFQMHVVSEGLLQLAFSRAPSLTALVNWVSNRTYVPRLGTEIIYKTIDVPLGRATCQWFSLETDLGAATHRLETALLTLSRQ